MLHNQVDLIEALLLQERFARPPSRCLWFAYEFGVVDSWLLIAAGVANDVDQVHKSKMMGAPLKAKWLEPNGIQVRGKTRSIAQYRLTEFAHEQMTLVLGEVERTRANAERLVRTKLASREHVVKEPVRPNP